MESVNEEVSSEGETEECFGFRGTQAIKPNLLMNQIRNTVTSKIKL
jgi:hypothetical protein